MKRSLLTFLVFVCLREGISQFLMSQRTTLRFCLAHCLANRTIVVLLVRASRRKSRDEHFSVLGRLGIKENGIGAHDVPPHDLRIEYREIVAHASSVFCARAIHADALVHHEVPFTTNFSQTADNNFSDPNFAHPLRSVKRVATPVAHRL